MDVTVIIPAFNEEDTIGELVSKILEKHPEFEVLVVDDGSSDHTAERAAAACAKVIAHPYNIGNGAAVKTGIRNATGDVLVFMDGDGQHPPVEIDSLLSHMGAFDMVVGARSVGDQASIGRAIGNKVYNWLASYVAKFKIEDLTSGFRAVRSDIARNMLYLLPNTYSYPTTITLGVLRSGRSVKYIPVRTALRKSGTSQIQLFRDGVRFFMIIMRICTLYSPLRIFLPVSSGIFALGLSYYAYTFFAWGRFTNMSALLFTTSVLVFMMGLISDQICQMRFDRSEGE